MDVLNYKIVIGLVLAMAFAAYKYFYPTASSPVSDNSSQTEDKK